MDNNRDFSKLCAVWNKIGPFNMDLFSHRLILQKKIFLLQQLGYQFDYQFGKYLRGPYCSQLATDGYKIKAIENIEGDGKLNDKSIEKIEKLGKDHEMDASWFELIATIVYFKNIEKKNKEETKKAIIEQKPYLFENNLFEEAYRKLMEIDLISI